MGHVDNHAIWIDPLNSQHVMYGNDGGLDVSYDGGATWESLAPAGARRCPYHVSADMRRPYWVCTGLQDNGIVVRAELDAQRRHPHVELDQRRRR